MLTPNLPRFQSRPQSWASLFGVALSVVVIGGCAGAIITQSSNDVEVRSGVLSTFSYAAAGRDMRTVVIGNPFQAGKADLDRAVVAAMQNRNNGPTTTFTTTPSESAREGYSVVVAFDPPPTLPNARLCESLDGVATEPARDRLRLVMVFCAGKSVESWVRSSAPRPSSPADPQFANLISQATRQLIPTMDDEPHSAPLVMIPQGRA